MSPNFSVIEGGGAGGQGAPSRADANAQASAIFGSGGENGRGPEMVEPTREEYDAKLAATEARLETHLTAIDGKLDSLVERIEGKFTRLEDQLLTLSAQTAEAKDASYRARDAAGNVKWNIAFTALAVIAVIVSMWAIWAQGVEMITGIVGAMQESSTQ